MIFDRWSKQYASIVRNLTKPYFNLIGTTINHLVIVKKPADLDEIVNPDTKVDVFGFYESVLETEFYKSFKFKNLYIKYPQEFFIEGKIPSEMEMEEIQIFLDMDKDFPLKIGDFIVDIKEDEHGVKKPIVLEITLIKSNFIGKYLMRKIANADRIFKYPKELDLHINKLLETL
jgi:hypothetical protein